MLRGELPAEVVTLREQLELLIPLALRGVQYRPIGAAALLRRSLLIYGVGGVVAPFAGIKLIDLVIAALGMV